LTFTGTDPLRLAADLLDPPDLDVFRLLGYHPEPPQERFHAANEYDVGYGGLAGAGKSLAAVMEAIRCAATYPGMWVGVFRRSYDELNESIISKVIPLQEALWEHFGAKLTTSGSPELRFRNGSLIRFRYAESIVDATRRQGGEYQLLIIDERQQVDPAVVIYLETRIRSGSPGLPVIGIRSTFNPGDIGHSALKERYIEGTDYGTKTYELTDPVTNAPLGRHVRFVVGERSPHIDEDYWKSLEAIADPVLRRQLAEGDWDAGGGLMFSETFRRAIHVIAPEQLPVDVTNAAVIRARGIDYGMTNPFCCLWAQLYPDNLVVVYRELYQTNLIPDEQAKLILASEDPAEHRAMSYVDPSTWTQYANVKRVPGVPPKSIASDYSKAGVSVAKANNDRIGGVRLVHAALRVRPDGMPRILIYNTCPNLIREVSSIPRSKVNSEDVDTRVSDHAFDALKYLLFGLLGKTTQPVPRATTVPRPMTAGMMDRPL
jgi:hypothetical protein